MTRRRKLIPESKELIFPPVYPPQVGHRVHAA